MAVLDAFITTYGLAAVAGISVASSIVWLISHFAAKPGGKVSVLWGLATYDRRESPELPKSSAGESIERVNDASGAELPADEQTTEKQVLVARIDDSLLIDTETQRASSDISVSRRGTPLSQLAIVTIILGVEGTSVIPMATLHLKRKRPGEILSALPQVLGEVHFRSACALTPLGIQVTLQDIHPGEKFRLQMLTDGLRATDFHLMQEPRSVGTELRIEKSEDWQP